MDDSDIIEISVWTFPDDDMRELGKKRTTVIDLGTKTYTIKQGSTQTSTVIVKDEPLSYEQVEVARTLICSSEFASSICQRIDSITLTAHWPFFKELNTYEQVAIAFAHNLGGVKYADESRHDIDVLHDGKIIDKYMLFKWLNDAFHELIRMSITYGMLSINRKRREES